MTMTEMDFTTLARTTDPETSHEAARSLTNRALADSRAAVYIALMHRGPSTDTQIVSWLQKHGTGFSDSRIRTARKEMTKPTDGRVKFTEEYDYSGRTRKRIWTAVSK